MRVRAFLMACCLVPFALQAQEPENNAVPEVIIDPGGVAPEALKAIHGAVDAITRLAEDQDLEEVSRLRRRAHDATVSALETQGYFDAVVNLEVGEDYQGETWDIVIQPGERTLVKTVTINFSGRITEPEFDERVTNLRQHWPLKPGEIFLNKEWSDAKSDLLQKVKSKDFYYARYNHTRALVTADLSQADLDLDIKSGPRVRMGELYTTGLQRVPESLVHRYVTYTPGEPYDQEKLDNWQQALQSTTFFRGAFVTLDENSAEQEVNDEGEVELPVLVRVTEAPARRFTGSIGADSDNGPRLEALYRQNIVFGLPVWVETGLGLDKNRQRLFADMHLPPTVSGFRNSLGVLYDHQDLEGLKQTRAAAGVKTKYDFATSGRADYESQASLMGVLDESKVRGETSALRSTSLELTGQILRRDVDNKYDPRQGNLVELGLGVNYPLEKKYSTLYRASLRSQFWFPVGNEDVFMLRAEAGKVWPNSERIPMGFGFRTGGARSIRGYKYQSIGISRASATVGAPAMAVLSAEYQHFFNSTFGMSVFMDVGDAAESFKAMSPHLGYGVGAAMRTPAGPFYVDLAYGQKTHDIRLHFSLGIAF